MRIHVLVQNTLVKSRDGRFQLVDFEYEDSRSTTVEEALESCWQICNGAHSRLSEAELALRDVWDARGGGLGLSVGDVVTVDGRAFRCAAAGWVGL